MGRITITANTLSGRGMDIITSILTVTALYLLFTISFEDEAAHPTSRAVGVNGRYFWDLLRRDGDTPRLAYHIECDGDHISHLAELMRDIYSKQNFYTWHFPESDKTTASMDRITELQNTINQYAEDAGFAGNIVILSPSATGKGSVTEVLNQLRGLQNAVVRPSNLRYDAFENVGFGEPLTEADVKRRQQSPRDYGAPQQTRAKPVEWDYWMNLYCTDVPLLRQSRLRGMLRKVTSGTRTVPAASGGYIDEMPMTRDLNIIDYNLVSEETLLKWRKPSVDPALAGVPDARFVTANPDTTQCQVWPDPSFPLFEGSPQVLLSRSLGSWIVESMAVRRLLQSVAHVYDSKRLFWATLAANVLPEEMAHTQEALQEHFLDRLVAKHRSALFDSNPSLSSDEIYSQAVALATPEATKLADEEMVSVRPLLLRLAHGPVAPGPFPRPSTGSWLSGLLRQTAHCPYLFAADVTDPLLRKEVKESVLNREWDRYQEYARWVYAWYDDVITSTLRTQVTGQKGDGTGVEEPMRVNGGGVNLSGKPLPKFKV
eukprot:Clim_evm11s149 gene=Clim_evmTU11s149